MWRKGNFQAKLSYLFKWVGKIRVNFKRGFNDVFCASSLRIEEVVVP